MLTRYNCEYCDGSGKHYGKDCCCEDLPNYRKLLDGDWQKSNGGECLVYAVAELGPCLIVDDASNVFITGMGQLPSSILPRDLAELSGLARALRMRVV